MNLFFVLSVIMLVVTCCFSIDPRGVTFDGKSFIGPQEFALDTIQLVLVHARRRFIGSATILFQLRSVGHLYVA